MSTDTATSNGQTDAARRVAERQRQAADRSARLDEIRAGLETLWTPGGVHEIRALNVCGRRKRVDAGWFDDLGRAAEAALKLDEIGATGIYLTANPCDPSLLARANNRIIEWAEQTTTDNEIIGRKWFPGDFDPHRLSGISATEEEKQAGITLAETAEEMLRARYGWPYPLIMDSGNGCYRLFRIALPNDDDAKELVKRVLLGIAALLGPQERVGEPYADLDLGMFNAARIIRIPGTRNRKGDNTPDRPHRRAMLYPPVDECPVAVVSLDLLQAVAAQAPEPVRQPTRQTAVAAGSNGHTPPRLDVERWLADRHVEYRAKDRLGGRGYLVACPFGTHGAAGESAVWQADSGLLTYECKHSSCVGRQWADYRDAIGKPDPDHYDPPLTRNGTKTRPAASIEPGTKVRAMDRDNFGEIVSDNGTTCTVHFVSPEGQAADVDLPKSQLRTADGKPVDGSRAASIDYQLISGAELLRRNYPVEQLVKGVLVKGQHTLWGGVLKGCKSLTVDDLAISLAAGVSWLGHFSIPHPVKTILLSGESGWPVLQENVRRIAKAAQVDLELLEQNLRVGVRLPKFGRPDYMDALAETVKREEAGVVILDCAYRCIPGDNASNLFSMGELLDSVGQVFEQCESTLILLHHSPKHIPPGEPLQLDNLAFAGFAEFAAGWILLNRQRLYKPGTGHHDLWMTIGARAGIGGTYGLTIDEGEYHEGQDREWRVSVTTGSNVRDSKKEERERDRETKRQEKMEEIKKRIVRAATPYKQGETATTIRDRAGLRDPEFKPALALLIESGDLQPVEIEKSNRKKPYPGYILSCYASPTHE